MASQIERRPQQELAIRIVGFAASTSSIRAGCLRANLDSHFSVASSEPQPVSSSIIARQLHAVRFTLQSIAYHQRKRTGRLDLFQTAEIGIVVKEASNRDRSPLEELNAIAQLIRQQLLGLKVWAAGKQKRRCGWNKKLTVDSRWSPNRARNRTPCHLFSIYFPGRS